MTRNAKLAFLRRSLPLWGTIVGCVTTAATLQGQIVIPAGAAFNLGAAPGNTETIDVSSFGTLGSIFWDADSSSQDSQVNDVTAGNPFGDVDLRDNLPTYITAGPGEQYGGVSGGWNYQRILAESGGTDFLGGVATTPPSGGEVVAFTIGAGAPANLQFSLVIDILDGIQFVPSSLTVAAGESRGTIGTTNVNRNGDVYSFNVLNLSEGDIVSVELGPSASINTLSGVLLSNAEPFQLNLVIDRGTGQATLHHNLTGSDVELQGYALTSAAGSLRSANWDSLESQGQSDQGAGAGNTDPSDGVGWEVLGTPGADFLAEFNLQSNTLLGSGGDSTLDFGSIYAAGMPEDVQITYSLANGIEVTLDAVFVDPSGLAGDFDGNGSVNSTDLTAPVVGFEARLGDDLEGRDFLAWQRNFGVSLSDSAAASAAVPEPSGGALLLCVCLAAGRLRRTGAWHTLAC